MATAKQVESWRRNGASFLGLGSKPIHGGYGTATYASWASMIQRCKNPNRPNYPWYGGRGVRVCAAWTNYANFLRYMGERPAGATLDRIDPNGHYEGVIGFAVPARRTSLRSVGGCLQGGGNA
jgi:hypothetical protein